MGTLHFARRLLWAIGLLPVAFTSCLAGPHQGGTLFLHANPSLVYSAGGDYCGDENLSSCGGAITNVSGNQPTVFFLLAAFPSGSTPRLRGVTFGLSYDSSEVQLLASGNCGTFDDPMPNWPAPCTGTAVTWSAPPTSLLVPVYWFVGQAYSATDPTVICVGPHPVYEGTFADDSVPSELDAVACYGCLGFNTTGLSACPPCGPVTTGACCLSDCCMAQAQVTCVLVGGAYMGDGSVCDPSPCMPVAVRPSTWGHIKARFR